MRRLALKRLSFEKQMTVLLPMVMLLALLMGMLAVSRKRETASVDAGEGIAAPSVSSPVSTAPAVNILLLLRDQSLDFITVVRFKPVGALITVSAIDPDIVLSGGTAAQIYQLSGASAVREQLEQTLALPLDFYADFSYDGLRRLVQYYGDGVSITLPQAVSRVDAVGLSVSFPAGKLHLSARQIYELMLAAAQTEATLRLPLVSSLWCGLFNDYLTPERELTRDFSAMSAACDTNIKIFHWEAYLPALEQMAQYAPVAVPVTDLPAGQDPAALEHWRQLWMG